MTRRTFMEAITGTGPSSAAVTDQGGPGLPRVPDDAPKGRAAERLWYAEALQELRHLSQALTEYAARLQGFIVNNTLLVGTWAFDTTACQMFQFKATCGSVTVVNLSQTNTITVSSRGQSPDNAAPTTGVGVFRIPPLQSHNVNVASTEITIYGTAADYFSAQFYTTGGRP